MLKLLRHRPETHSIRPEKPVQTAAGGVEEGNSAVATSTAFMAGGGEGTWQTLSVALSHRGEVLYVEHR